MPQPSLRHYRALAVLLLLPACTGEAPTDGSPSHGLTLGTEGPLKLTGLAGVTLDTIVVTVRDAAGNPKGGEPVTWAGTPLSAIERLDLQTSADGRARVLWALAATTDTQRLTASAGTATLTFEGLVPLGPVRFTPSALSLWVGDAAPPIAIEARDSAGTALRHQPRWSNPAPNVVGMDGDGGLTGLAVGAVTLRIAGAPNGVPVIVTPVGTGGTIAGRAIRLDAPGSPVELTVRYQDRQGSGTGTSQSDGTWSVFVKHTIHPADTARIALVSSGTDRDAYHPSFLIVPITHLDPSLQVVLIPFRWTVRQGTHAGTVVGINADAAFRPATNRSFWSSAHGENYFFITQELWAPSALPVAVALAPRTGEPAFSAEDSLFLWSELDRMEQVMGRDLFRPAPGVLADPFPPVQDYTIHVQRALGSPVAGITRSATRWSVIDTLLPSSSFPNAISVNIADALQGEVQLPFPPSSPSWYARLLVQHEFTHALGIGHGCGWESVMEYCPEGVVQRTRELSPGDVAYFEVLDAARELERSLGTTYSLIPALYGLRVLMLGKRLLPEEGE